MSERALARAVAAAVVVASAYDVSVRDPEVLHDGANVIVHLRPAPVVARVAALTAAVRYRPAEFLARDVALAGYLAPRGAGVVPPADELPPGPHRHEGRTMTFWRFVDHDTDHPPEPRAVGRALAELHDLLRGYASELPYLGPVLYELQDVLERLHAHGVLPREAASHYLDRLAACEQTLPRPDSFEQALHGDAHPRNALMVDGRITWTDFEDTCAGSVAWDLACLGRRAGPDAIEGYGDDRPTDAECAAYFEARELQSEVWQEVFKARSQLVDVVDDASV